MKNLKLSKLFLLLVIFASCGAFASEYLYSKLQMKSFDEMMNEVKARVQKAEKDGNEDVESAKTRLKDALLLIFSRPNRDNMVSQLIPTVRSPLKNLEAYEDTISDLADDALAKLAIKSAKPDAKATALIILENIMSELKPDINSNPKVKSIFEKIRDAKIVVGNDIKNELRMRSSLKPSASPSEIAAKVLAGAK